MQHTHNERLSPTYHCRHAHQGSVYNKPNSQASYENGNRIKFRQSNLELYRIIVMFLIVSHHYVVHGGILEKVIEEPIPESSIPILIFGAWGKTGINCFIMITGWFMSSSNFTWRKFFSLYFQIAVYALSIYLFFCVIGQESFNPITALMTLLPMDSVSNHFVSAFLLFYLLIPFINILITNINKTDHAILLLILLFIYTILPTNPWFELKFNYISWFTVVYLLSSFIRKYGLFSKVNNRTWGLITIILVSISAISIYILSHAYIKGHFGAFRPYMLVGESNLLLPLLIGISSFMYFKDVKIPYLQFINVIGATTFGILLIHDNALMRGYLWRDLLDSACHVTNSLSYTIGYAIGCVFIVFTICSGIDWLRDKLIQPTINKLISKIS